METMPLNREWTTVSKKKREGQPAGTHSGKHGVQRKGPMSEIWYRAWGLPHRTGSASRTLFEVPLGDAIGRTNGVSGTAQLITKDERSRTILAGLQILNWKTCSFHPLESSPRRTYILMGVPKCITAQILLQDDQVHEAERMTRWDPVLRMRGPRSLLNMLTV